MSKSLKKDAIYAYEPDLTCKNIIGADVDLETVLTPEKIKNCQKIIDEARAEFFDECASDYHKAKKAFQSNEPDFSAIDAFIKNIRGLAKIFGYSFIENLSTEMIIYSEKAAENDKKSKKILDKLFALLEIGITQKLGLEHPDIETSLVQEMKKVLKKKEK